MELLAYFENTGLAIWLRESPSILAYPTLLAFHTFGMAFLVGTSSAFALRLIGIAPGVPLAPLKKFVPLIRGAFVVSLISGLLLLLLDLQLFLTMPTFYIKLLFIAAALIILRIAETRVYSGPAPGEEPVLGITMLVCWAGAIATGRVTAYAPYIGWQSGAALIILVALLLVGRRITLRFLG